MSDTEQVCADGDESHEGGTQDVIEGIGAAQRMPPESKTDGSGETDKRESVSGSPSDVRSVETSPVGSYAAASARALLASQGLLPESTKASAAAARALLAASGGLPESIPTASTAAARAMLAATMPDMVDVVSTAQTLRAVTANMPNLKMSSATLANLTASIADLPDLKSRVAKIRDLTATIARYPEFGAQVTDYVQSLKDFRTSVETWKESAVQEMEAGENDDESDAVDFALPPEERDEAFEQLLEATSKLREHEEEAEGAQEAVQLEYLKGQIPESAYSQLASSKEFLDSLFSREGCKGFVVSVDIRRSTDLMLKAEDPAEFAIFVTRLCARLKQVVLQNFGIFDKFTGDGILAFFPECYSGRDAGYYALCAADECHSAFVEEYKASYDLFDSVVMTGLGIGIDYGTLHIVEGFGNITAIGRPVVYACRMGAGEAGSVLLNRPAYRKLSDKYSEYLVFEETKLEVKNQGSTLAYHTSFGSRVYKPVLPTWRNGSVQQESSLWGPRE